MVAPQTACSSCTPGAIVFEPLSGDQVGRDFDARIFGDCSGNWAPANAAISQLASGTREPARLRFGRPRPRGRSYVEVPIWLHVRRPLYSLDVEIELTGENARARFRTALPPDGALLQHRRGEGGRISLALASARPLPAASTRIGSLLLRRSDDRYRLRRDLRVRAFTDDIAIRVHVPR
jgi:hypothetical protein